MMRTIEVGIVIFILLSTFVAASYFIVLPSPREVSPHNLRALALTILKNLDSLREICELIRKKAEVGEVKELEVIKLNVEILKAENELKKILSEKEILKSNLNKYLGNSLPPDFKIKGELRYFPLKIEEKILFKKALSIHPLIKKKEIEVERAENILNYTKWQRIPDPTIKGFISREMEGENRGIAFSFEIPLWNFKTKEIAEAKNLALKVREELKALKLEFSVEIKSKLNKLKLAEKTIELFTKGLLKQAEESMKISEVSYREGEISLIEYLDSRRTYYSIVKDFYEALYDWNLAKASLEKSIGEEIK